VEADAALVGADRVVVLDAVAALDADVAVVVLPADAERDHPVGLGDAAQDLLAEWYFSLSSMKSKMSSATSCTAWTNSGWCGLRRFTPSMKVKRPS
jgi:hypothetical protein